MPFFTSATRKKGQCCRLSLAVRLDYPAHMIGTADTKSGSQASFQSHLPFTLVFSLF